MGRWTQYDEDEYRLPEGFKRVGYDADTQRYTFKDGRGNLWRGLEGQEFGQMRREDHDDNTDLEASAPTSVDGYRPLSTITDESLRNRNKDAWRQLLPFLLIVLVCLLLVLRLFSPFLVPSQSTPCSEHTRAYLVKAGDSCWAIAKDYDTSLESLRITNPNIDCATLVPGQRICVPMKD